MIDIKALGRRLRFEEHLDNFEIYGSVVLVEEGGRRPTKIVRTDQSWKIKYYIAVRGSLARLVCGYLRIKLFMEQYGVKEFDLRNAEKKECLVSDDYYVYEGEISIPAYEIPEGLFDIAVVVTMTDRKGLPGPVAGNTKFKCVQFYNPGPHKVSNTEALAESEVSSENGR